MAGPISHFDPKLASDRRFPSSYDKALFLFDWERSWIRIARLDSEGHLQRLVPLLTELNLKRPISMAFGPDDALYLIEWGSAWYHNTGAQVVRIDPIPE